MPTAFSTGAILAHFGNQTWHFLVIFGIIFWTTFWSIFGPLLGAILGPILGPDRPKREQDEPKRAIRSFKDPKSFIFKNLEKPLVFLGFWVQRPPKRASRGPRRLPRGTQRAPKPQKKGSKNEPKNKAPVENALSRRSRFWPILGPILGPKIGLFLGSFFGPLFGHFLDHFWVPFWG